MSIELSLPGGSSWDTRGRCLYSSLWETVLQSAPFSATLPRNQLAPPGRFPWGPRNHPCSLRPRPKRQIDLLGRRLSFPWSAWAHPGPSATVLAATFGQKLLFCGWGSMIFGRRQRKIAAVDIRCCSDLVGLDTQISVCFMREKRER